MDFMVRGGSSPLGRTGKAPHSGAFLHSGRPARPRQYGMAMPPEWALHELTLMAWPTRLELWGDALGRAKGGYAASARAIAGFERVLMVAAPGAGGEVRDACG